MYHTFALRNYRKLAKDKFANSLQELVSSRTDDIDSDLMFDYYTSGVREFIDMTCMPHRKPNQSL